MSPQKNRLVLIVAAAILVLCAAALFLWLEQEPAKADFAPPAAASYVGAQACVACHAKESEAWRTSQHALAMQDANEKTVLGDFSGAVFEQGGESARFFRRDGKVFVHTPGRDGKPADFEIAQTFGLAPLQQYLIDLPDGRKQALGVAWDARPKDQGGQRWFHLYPDPLPKPGQALHWSGIDQNWNYQCADCHSTNLRKHFDAGTGQFATRWSEMNVACEACHGPASRHLAWAEKKSGWQTMSGKGLMVTLDERRHATWVISAATGNAARSQPRESGREIEVCARCHARRGQFTDDFAAGQPFHDAFRPALIEPGLYYPDGQQRDEVYTYGSFLQSRMHAAGVTCSDCHEPHGGKVRAPGNALCAQCHAPAKYNAPAHHHHAAGSGAATCTACHMPTTVYMGVDPRHDHSFRIPRPDRSVSIGTPNACNGCHRDKSAKWADKTLHAWFPQLKQGFQTFAEAFHGAETGAPGARAALVAVVDNREMPPYVRASALTRLNAFPSRQTVLTAADALKDSDPDVRLAAVGVLASLDAESRLQSLPRMLNDASRLVRMDTARALAGESQRLSTTDRPVFERALDEYVAAQNFNADRPEAQANLGGLYAVQGKFPAAEAALRQALKLDPEFFPASINLADVYRAQGREADAAQVLRDSLEKNPQTAALHHALGLSLVRLSRVQDALDALAKANQLEPANVRYAYVYAIALHDSGQGAQAIKILEATLKRQPGDRNLLSALTAYETEAGHTARAQMWGGRLQELGSGE